VTTLERVYRARRSVLTAVALSAFLWGMAVAMGAVIVAALVNAIAPLSDTLRGLIIPLSGAAAVAAASAILWRGRAVRSLERLALWIEEREPELQYALVAVADPRLSRAELSGDLMYAASRAAIEETVGRATRRAVGRALGAAGLATAVLLLLQPRDLLRAAAMTLGKQLTPRAPGGAASRLTPLSARVIPPAYSRLPPRTLEEPRDVAALIGSAIVLSGRGSASGITVGVGADGHGVAVADAGWRAQLTMPKDPAVVTLRDREYQRLLVLAPVVDSAPVVTLRLPAHDTTYQTIPKGAIAIDATATDDIGLAYGLLEYLVSSGSEEAFQTVLVQSARVDFGNARAGTLHATIALDTLKLVPGSVVHIRAVAFDANDVTGPGKGVSETRTIRIAEKPDSTSITAAAPLPIDSMWISQRLLNMKTDTLIRMERRLAREEVVHRSSGYSNAQEDIRRRVMAVVALLEDNGVGGSFFTDESKLLRQAADLMWSAREDLGIAQPDSAMPYMKRALKILDDARMAYRYYLRGIMRPVVVNIERVRLQGKDTAAAAPLAARAALPDANAALAARIAAAVTLYRSAPAAALDSLIYVRVAALRTAPPVAAALQRAIEGMRQGISLDSALVPTRRLLAPPARLVTGPPAWRGGGSER